MFGARKMIYVKDEDGLFTADPKKDRNAEHIPRISVQELLERDLDDLIVERAVLELMPNARHIREIQFVNGLKPGQLTAALDGEPVGTIISTTRQGRRMTSMNARTRSSLLPPDARVAGRQGGDRGDRGRRSARILPHVNVIKIGGRSIMDRGRPARAAIARRDRRKSGRHTQIIGVGAGVRSRHILSVGLDLGLPTGALATLAAKSRPRTPTWSRACSPARFVYLEAPFIVQLLPAMLAAARGAVFNGIPPYDLWEHPPAVGKIPPHRTDAGSYLVAEVFGART